MVMITAYSMVLDTFFGSVGMHYMARGTKTGSIASILTSSVIIAVFKLSGLGTYIVASILWLGNLYWRDSLFCCQSHDITSL